jgi:GNAT superfamily N-acetyltransferase
MLTTEVLNAVADFSYELHFLHKLDALDKPGSLQDIQSVLCRVAAKALDVSLAVSRMFPTEAANRIAARIASERNGIDLAAKKLDRSFEWMPVETPRNLHRALKRIRAAQEVRLRSLPSFYPACLDGHQLGVKGCEVPPVDFDFFTDKLLACRLHEVGLLGIRACSRFLEVAGACPDIRARLSSLSTHDSGFKKLDNGLMAPPVIELASELLWHALVRATCGRIAPRESDSIFVIKNPTRSTQSIGFVLLDADVTSPASRPFVELIHFEMAVGYVRIGLGRRLFRWVRQQGRAKGFTSIWVKKAKAEASMGFWTKMGFKSINDEWLVHGPISE